MQRLTTRNPTMHSRVTVVFCVRNEKFRLPFFLKYYRDLGVSEFYAVDNGSDDGTREYLLDQADVNLFVTQDSYKSSNAGRDWTSEICRTLLDNRWCLTLDVDEFFVYPYMEVLTLSGLIDYLEANSFDGVTSLFLDFYSNKPLSETEYQSGQSPFEVCQYFDNASQYFSYPNENFPFFEIKGGPRQRIFWKNDELTVGPSMRKTVLVKWKASFNYLIAAHSCTPIRLADFTSAVAHFKFLSHFKDFAKMEVARNERVSNSKDWKIYASALEKQDLNFFDASISCQYRNSVSLIEQALVVSSPRFTNYAKSSQLQLDPQSTHLRLSNDIFKDPKQTMEFSKFLTTWGSYSLLSKQMEADTSKQQELAQIEHKLDMAASSTLWRITYRLRKLASKWGLTDQRSLTEENYINQNLVTRFTFIYDSIWWDLLGPFRVIVKVLRRVGILKYRP